MTASPIQAKTGSASPPIMDVVRSCPVARPPAIFLLTLNVPLPNVLKSLLLVLVLFLLVVDELVVCLVDLLNTPTNSALV